MQVPLKYATSVTVRFRLVKKGVVDLAVGTDWTPGAGDVKVSIDGGALQNTIHLPTNTPNGSRWWALVLDSTEVTGQIIGVEMHAPASIEDQALDFYTYGNANAAIVRDLSVDPWDETAASHNTGGTTGYLLNAAGVAADPWVQPLPGAYTAGEAGYIIGNLGSDTTNINAIKAQTDKIQFNASNQVITSDTSNVKKNQALSNFKFLMRDSVTKQPVAGRTVTATRALDGGGQAAGTLSAVTSIGNGEYAVDFAAADMNANTVMFRATAAGCDDTWIEIITEP